MKLTEIVTSCRCPYDHMCPECKHYLTRGKGEWYCDCTHGETFNCVCPLALKRYPCL